MPGPWTGYDDWLADDQVDRDDSPGSLSPWCDDQEAA